MVGWYVKGADGFLGPFCKEHAERFAEQIGAAVTIDEYAKWMIENSRNIIYQNQEGRTEKERRRRNQRTWFISYLLRW